MKKRHQKIEEAASRATYWCAASNVQVGCSLYIIHSGYPEVAIIGAVFAWLFIQAAFRIDPGE